METKQCDYTKEDGQQCGAWALKGKNYCFRHDSDSRALSLEASRRGGLMNKTGIEIPLEAIPVSTTKDVVALLSHTINDVRAGNLDPRIANTIGYLATALIKALEITEIEAKVKAISAILLGREADNKERSGK